MTAGQEFVKMLKPVGCVIFLAIFVAFLIMCFTAGGAPIEGYSVPHNSEYFREHPDELKTELEANVFPHLDGIESCEVTDGKLAIGIEADSFDESSGAITHYYSDELFSFQKIK